MTTRGKVAATLSVVALAAVAFWYVRAPAPGPALSPLQAPEGALTPNLINVTVRPAGQGSKQLVILLGENHASVRAQAELFSVLKGLYDRKALDAILVEGSDGPVADEEFAKKLAANSRGNDLASFWKEQIEWGRVNGSEAFAIAHPTVPVVGVEDMVAKARHANGLELEGIEALSNQASEGLRLLEQAVSVLGQGAEADANGLKKLLGDVKTAAEGVTDAAHAFKEKAPQYLEVRVETARIQPELRKAEALQEKLKPLWPDAQRLGKLVDEYNGLVKETGGRPDFLTRSRMENLKNQIDSLEAKLEPHADDFKKLESFQKEFNQLSDRLKPVSGGLVLEALSSSLTAAYRKYEDSYFVLANAIARAAQAQNKSFPEVQSFFRDQARALMDNDLKRAEPLREARDKAMVSNLVAYLKRTGKANVVLVVGYAHFTGIAARLQKEGLAVLGGGFVSNEKDLEPWEKRAWGKRDRGESVYSPGERATKKVLKPLLKLLNEQWKNNETARLDLFRRLGATEGGPKPSFTGLAQEGVLYEKVVEDKDVTVHISRAAFDRNADVGAQLADRGPVPGRPGYYYETYDRDAARKQVKDLSDAIASFVYYYRTVVDGKPAYQFATAQNTVSLPEFTAKPPGVDPDGPRRVVMFGEPDMMTEEGTLVVSPLWQRLRGSGPERIGKSYASPEPKTGTGSDGGGKPPEGNGAATAPGGAPRRWTNRWKVEPDGGSEPVEVYRTVNARRAKEKVKILSAQKPEFLGEITYLREGQLDQLPFTPSRGDNAQTVVIVARNIAEFRAELDKAAKEKRLENKQVALIMCGDAFPETSAIRETLLSSGALLVWTPDRQVTPEGADKLVERIKKTEKSYPVGARPVSMERVINHALMDWYKDSPSDPDLMAFRGSASWVLVVPASEHHAKG